MILFALETVAAALFDEGDEVTMNVSEDAICTGDGRLVLLDKWIVYGFVLASGLKTILDTPAFDDFLRIELVC